MSVDHSYWIVYNILLPRAFKTPDSGVDYGFSGNAKQRRKALRCLIRDIRPGNEVVVTKRKWKKGMAAHTATTVWTRHIQT